MTIKPIFRISVVLGLCLALVACESDKKGHPDMRLPVSAVDVTVADAPWPADLLADVAAVTIDDFDLLDAGAAGVDIDDSLDLVAIAVRP